jgi:hypothetical protein
VNTRDSSISEAWERATDDDIIQALHVCPEEYDRETLDIIEAVARRRGVKPPPPEELERPRSEWKAYVEPALDLYQVAVRQRCLLRLVLLYLCALVGAVGAAVTRPYISPGLADTVYAVCGVVIVVYPILLIVLTASLQHALGGGVSGTVLVVVLMTLVTLASAFGACVGFINLAIILFINYRATKRLHSAGVRVGLLGVSHAAVRELEAQRGS